MKMTRQLTDDSSGSDFAHHAGVVARSHSTTEWLLVVACAFTAVSAAIDGELWSAAGFSAIGAAVLLRALRLPERNHAWRWVVYLLLVFSIGLWILRALLRLGGAV
jgi:hypothetical protein